MITITKARLECYAPDNFGIIYEFSNGGIGGRSIGCFDEALQEVNRINGRTSWSAEKPLPRLPSGRLATKGVSTMGLSISSNRARAEALFKKDGQLREGQKAMTEYEAERQAVQEKIARLRALRLTRDAVVLPGTGVPAKRSSRP